MKPSQLVLFGVVASAACLFLCLRIWTRNDDGQVMNHINAADESTGRPTGDHSPTSLAGAGESHQREGIAPRPSLPPAQPDEVKPLPAPHPPVESASSKSTIEE